MPETPCTFSSSVETCANLRYDFETNAHLRPNREALRISVLASLVLVHNLGVHVPAGYGKLNTYFVKTRPVFGVNK